LEMVKPNNENLFAIFFRFNSQTHMGAEAP